MYVVWRFIKNEKKTKNNQIDDVEKVLNLMRKPKPNHNKEILKLLEKLWQKYSNMRLGQLMENFVFLDGERGDKTSQKLYYQYDEKTIRKINEELRRK